jgi:hypothetical protein
MRTGIRSCARHESTGCRDPPRPADHVERGRGSLFGVDRPLCVLAPPVPARRLDTQVVSPPEPPTASSVSAPGSDAIAGAATPSTLSWTPAPRTPRRPGAAHRIRNRTSSHPWWGPARCRLDSSTSSAELYPCPRGRYSVPLAHARECVFTPRDRPMRREITGMLSVRRPRDLQCPISTSPAR